MTTNNKHYSRFIKVIYNQYKDNAQDKILSGFFKDWKANFDLCYPLSDPNKLEPLFRALEKTYELKVSPSNLYPFFFALQTGFSIILHFTIYLYLHSLIPTLQKAYPFRITKHLCLSIVEQRYLKIFPLKDRGSIPFFAWIASFIDKKMIETLQDILPGLNSMMSPLLEQEFPDLFKNLYQIFFPRSLRHSLGEYYTPDWLVQYLTYSTIEPDYPQKDFHPNKLDLSLETSFFDPNCGSGSFILEFLRLKISRIHQSEVNPNHLLSSILSTVKGMDVNPIAVECARLNMIAALCQYLESFQDEVIIPIHHQDSLLLNQNGDWAEDNTECFDYIIGNPPWINWEFLPMSYRQKTKELWISYGLFPHSGLEAIMGKGRKDLSMLIIYHSMDKFLKPNGRLGFVITQSLLKTTGSSQGFRKFQLREPSEQSIPLRVLKIEDLAHIKPFQNTSNKAALLYLEKGRPTQYPIPYYVWKKTNSYRLTALSDLSSVLKHTNRLNHLAEPVNTKELTSTWITGDYQQIRRFKSMLGPSDYIAHVGINTGGANAIFWLNIIDHKNPFTYYVKNDHKGAKNQFGEYTFNIERDIVFPLAKAKDIQKWKIEPSGWILFSQDCNQRRGIDEEMMNKQYPLALQYLSQFKSFLIHRPVYQRYFVRQKSDGSSISKAPFYSMFGSGTYTLSPYKVVWRNIASKIEAAVASSKDKKIVIPQHTITMVCLENLQEAHYVCAVINSSLFNDIVCSFSQVGGKSFGDPHLLKYIYITAFNQNNQHHTRLSSLSIEAHKNKEKGDEKAIKSIESEIDQIIDQMY